MNRNLFSAKKYKKQFSMARQKSRLSWYSVYLFVFLALIGCLTFASTMNAIGNIARRQNPTVALRFVPDEPVALSFKADQLFASSQNSEDLKKVEKLAKQSLIIYPLNATALRLLGWVADVRGEKYKAKNLNLLATKVSRRDFGAQLWLIENAVAAGNKKQALSHYNVALSTTKSSYDVLFPTLIGALADPEVRHELVRYVRQTPEWLSAFLSEAVSASANPANVADVLLFAGPLPSTQAYQALSNRLLSELANKSKFAAFRQYYLSLPNTKLITLQSAAIDKRTVDLVYPAAGWRVTDSAAIGGTFSEDSGNYRLSAFAGSGQRGTAMQKYLFLDPGNYRFAAKYRIVNGSQDSAIDWSIRCLDATAETNLLTGWGHLKGGGAALSHDFSISKSCKAQLATLQIAGGSGQTGTDFLVTSVMISRL